MTKNIHVLTTPNPSRLYFNRLLNILQFCEISKTSTVMKENQNIYITSDELPKYKEWGLNTANNVVFIDAGFTPDEYAKNNFRKVIITTDELLIKDGVQAIDDDFLEWFVNNSSCEEVEVKKDFIQTPDNLKDGFYYKIIIPKEEPKLTKEFQEVVDFNDKIYNEETLEEAAEKFRSENPGTMYGGNNTKIINAFINGAKWQKERSYSGEEVNAFLNAMDETYSWINDSGDSIISINTIKNNFPEWFKQFKKK